MDATVLIVDDSPYIVDGLIALLKRKGFNPVPAHGGDEALAVLNTTTPDLILLDIMMEPMDGWETLEKIKANPKTRESSRTDVFSAKKITPEEAQEHSRTVVLAAQENFIRRINRDGKTVWKYPSGVWVGGVGISGDGSVIAAGTITNTLYILDREGSLVAQTKTDTYIRQRSVAMDKQVKRVVVADQAAAPAAGSRRRFRCRGRRGWCSYRRYR